MKIRVIEPYHSQAMRRWAQPILDNFDAFEGAGNADIDYHIPWHGLVKEPTGSGKQVMFYTHTNPGMEKDLEIAVSHADAVICMSETGVKEIKEICPRVKPVRCIYPYLDDFGPRKIRVGIVGSEQPNGRKGAHQLLELAWLMDLSPFMFCIVGTGWDYVVEKLKNIGVSVDYKHSIPNLMPFYAEMDVVLCTGHEEGGPLPLIEALACGKPVISADHGLGKDIGVNGAVYHYENIDGLKTHLETLAEPVIRTKSLVDHMTLSSFIDDHRRFFTRLLGEKPSCRYDHVDRIVDEISARRLMEIGTWTGIRAASMLRTAREKIDQPIHYYGFDLFQQADNGKLAKEGSLAKKPPSASSVQLKLNAIDGYSGLIMGDTKETLAGWSGYIKDIDFIFIDGGHSWETIDNDWEKSQAYAHPSTVFLLDDYYYNDPSEVEGIGCQRLVQRLSAEGGWLVEYLEPVEDWPQPWGVLKIGMVRIQRVPMESTTVPSILVGDGVADG